MAVDERAATGPPAEREKLQEAEIEELRISLMEAEQQIAEIPALRERSAELDRLTSSMSWRLTAPLRSLGRPLRRRWLRLGESAAGRVILRIVGGPRP